VILEIYIQLDMEELRTEQKIENLIQFFTFDKQFRILEDIFGGSHHYIKKKFKKY